MQLHSFIAAVGLVATTNALLLPPDLPTSESDVITTLPVPTEIDVDIAISRVPETQTLALKCPGCLRHGPKHRNEIPSHLKLDFSIESTNDVDRLTVNGCELFPNPDPLRDTLTAPVLPDMFSRKMGIPPRFKGGPNRPQRIQPLGFGMQTQVVTTDDEDDLQLINVEIQIIEVGNIFNKDIPNVQVKLLKTPSGKLAIANIDIIDSTAKGSAQKQKVCSTMLCRWKTLLFEKLSYILKSKGCSSRPAGHPHHGGNRHGHGHGHGPRPHHNGWGKVFMVFAVHILLPMALGLAAGLSACFIGMMLGHMVVFLWRTFFRRSGSQSSHRCQYAHKEAQDENAVEDEKSGLMDHQEEAEALPPYVEEGLGTFEDKKPENEV